VTPFQRINLGIGVAMLALVAGMAISQTQLGLGVKAGPASVPISSTN
jgi:hypothetical protein